MRKLRCDINSFVAERWDWTLPVQCVWVVPQNEWTESSFDQAKKKAGEYTLKALIPGIHTVHSKTVNLYDPNIGMYIASYCNGG